MSSATPSAALPWPDAHPFRPRRAPLPLRRWLVAHEVATAWQRGWSELSNGDLLTAAEATGFDLLITTDQNLRYQQNLSDRRIAILVLTVANWPMLQPHATGIAAIVDSMQPGEYREWSMP